MKKLGHLVLMAKEPRIGLVKSRLASEIGIINAWNFYRFNLARITNRLLDDRWHCWIAITPDSATKKRAIKTDGWKQIAQGTGDLGRRMLAPMQTLPPGPVVIIGSDIPDINKQHINDAFRLLGKADMVFGPSADGGYWLVGQRRRPVLLNPFNNVRWSSENALDDTLAGTLKGPRNLRINFLNTLNDIDCGQDYFSFKRGISSTKLHGLNRESS
ncbi:MAG: glycosyltransferase [Rhodospirillaceae bacterium]|nr:glycosyltransferase [Rhodospirillaceae bacterium]